MEIELKSSNTVARIGCAEQITAREIPKKWPQRRGYDVLTRRLLSNRWFNEEIVGFNKYFARFFFVDGRGPNEQTKKTRAILIGIRNIRI